MFNDRCEVCHTESFATANRFLPGNARLATVMQQVSALAVLNDDERVWVDEVTVGDATVKLGLNPGRQGRVQIIRR